MSLLIVNKYHGSKNKRLHQIYGFGPKREARTLLPNFDGIPVGHLRSHAPGLGDRCLSAGFKGMVEELRPHHIGTDVKSECADRGLVFIGRSGVHQEGIQLRGL